jgi:hypothetical protein
MVFRLHGVMEQCEIYVGEQCLEQLQVILNTRDRLVTPDLDASIEHEFDLLAPVRQ